MKKISLAAKLVTVAVLTVPFIYERDENGNTYEVKKDSYYYLYTLKNALGEYTFDSEIEAYDENVMIYKYKKLHPRCVLHHYQ